MKGLGKETRKYLRENNNINFFFLTIIMGQMEGKKPFGSGDCCGDGCEGLRYINTDSTKYREELVSQQGSRRVELA